MIPPIIVVINSDSKEAHYSPLFTLDLNCIFIPLKKAAAPDRRTKDAFLGGSEMKVDESVKVL